MLRKSTLALLLSGLFLSTGIAATAPQLPSPAGISNPLLSSSKALSLRRNPLKDNKILTLTRRKVAPLPIPLPKDNDLTTAMPIAPVKTQTTTDNFWHLPTQDQQLTAPMAAKVALKVKKVSTRPTQKLTQTKITAKIATPAHKISQHKTQPRLIRHRKAPHQTTHVIKRHHRKAVHRQTIHQTTALAHTPRHKLKAPLPHTPKNKLKVALSHGHKHKAALAHAPKHKLKAALTHAPKHKHKAALAHTPKHKLKAALTHAPKHKHKAALAHTPKHKIKAALHKAPKHPAIIYQAHQAKPSAKKASPSMVFHLPTSNNANTHFSFAIAQPVKAAKRHHSAQRKTHAGHHQKKQQHKRYHKKSRHHHRLVRKAIVTPSPMRQQRNKREHQTHHRAAHHPRHFNAHQATLNSHFLQALLGEQVPHNISLTEDANHLDQLAGKLSKPEPMPLHRYGKASKSYYKQHRRGQRLPHPHTKIKTVRHRPARQNLAFIIQHVLATNPQVLSKQSNWYASIQALRQVYGGYLPTVDLSLGMGRERSDNPTLRNLGISQRYLNRKESSINLTQLLYDGGKVGGLVEERIHQAMSAKYDMYNTEENLALEATQAYVNILRYDRLTKLAKDNVRLHRRILNKVRTLHEGGATHRANVELAESRKVAAEASLLREKQLLANAKVDFTTITALPAKRLVKMTRQPRISAKTFRQAKRIALTTNPAVSASIANLNASNAAIKATRADFFPTVSLELSTSNNSNIDGVKGKNADLLGMVVLRYNLFRGGADKARVREAAERRSEAFDDLAQVNREVRRSIQQSWENIRAYNHRYRQLYDYVKVSRKLLLSYRDQFVLGKQTLFNVLDAGNQLFNAEVAHANIRYDNLIEHYRLLAGMGLLVRTNSLQKTSKHRK